MPEVFSTLPIVLFTTKLIFMTWSYIILLKFSAWLREQRCSHLQRFAEKRCRIRWNNTAWIIHTECILYWSL